ncbi:hypothetical protein CPB83DRAFT_902514 [Crepidotus variabilis]|uniref:DUF8021 domain-containing protein n=1 Tax=Crepidotus variabilis TaxID=179855 RepID=A0A9P6ER07_9AGAR|nr:hypothetical protein CPB83DRAFT_902514 [Crepidotus variabilis]
MFRTFFVSALCAALATPTLAACTFSQLQNITAAYIAAQSTGKLPARISSATYTENFKSAHIQKGIISKALKIDHNRSLYDTVTCSTFTELIVASNSHPYVLGTQIALADDRTKIKRIDTIITTTGDWQFNATGTLYWSKQEDIASGWETIPEENRDTRAVIKAAADAYLDVFSDSAVVVPWGTPCAKLEGGLYSGTGEENDSCNTGVPSGTKIVNRRYVIDETVGSVDVFLNFGGDKGNPDSHNFRILEGNIRYIHTITHGQILGF